MLKFRLSLISFEFNLLCLLWNPPADPALFDQIISTFRQDKETLQISFLSKGCLPLCFVSLDPPLPDIIVLFNVTFNLFLSLTTCYPSLSEFYKTNRILQLALKVPRTDLNFSFKFSRADAPDLCLSSLSSIVYFHTRCMCLRPTMACIFTGTILTVLLACTL